jgi:epoxide hydrolase-like predicted phosphatase
MPPYSTQRITRDNKGEDMSIFKTVLFDWEGVMGAQDTESFGWLMNRPPKEYDVTREQAVAALGACIGDFMIGKINNQEFWKRVGERLGVTFTDEFQETIWQDWHGAEPIPEMEALVQEVKAMGLRVVVFSNILPTSAAKVREIAGYEGFDAELLSCEVGVRKPDPAIYGLAVQVAKCLPAECIFIDDKEKNLLPARNLGMTTILAVDTDQVRRDLLNLIQTSR